MAKSIKKSKSDKDLDKMNKQLHEALNNPEIQKIYANGFINATGMGDIVILLKNADTPLAVLNLSYTVAKTLAIKLGDVITRLEEATKNTIMTTDEITKAMAKRENK